MATNPICELLNISHPIILGPFGGLSSVELTAAVSTLGGLGCYGLYGYSPERILETIAELREATAQPFAVNLWLPTGSEVAPADVDLSRAAHVLAPFFDEVDLPIPAPPEHFLPDFDAQLEAALEAKPAALSLVFGVPPAWVRARAREQGTAIIGTATTVAEAEALEAGGVDAIVATGFEAAGHRTAFLGEPEAGLVGTFSLVPQVVDAVNVPVIAAGGVADRRGVRAAFALGASAVQVGTAFLAARESAASPAHRDAIRGASADGSVLTRALSGRLSRGAPNRAVRAIEAGDAIAPFPAQNWLTGQFRKEAGRRNLGELQSLWLGQSAPLAKFDDAGQVFAELQAGLPG